MKTYQFIVTVSNSTIVEVQSDNYDEALGLALTQFHESEIIHDLCDPRSMGVDIELDEEFDGEVPEMYPL